MSTSSKVSVEKHLASLTLTSGPPRKRASSSLSRSKAVSRESTPPLGVEPLLLLLIFNITNSRYVSSSSWGRHAASEQLSCCLYRPCFFLGLAYWARWPWQRRRRAPPVCFLAGKSTFLLLLPLWSSWWDARKLFLLFSAPSKPHTHTLGKALLLLPNTGSVTRFKPLSGMQKENDLRTGSENVGFSRTFWVFQFTALKCL